MKTILRQAVLLTTLAVAMAGCQLTIDDGTGLPPTESIEPNPPVVVAPTSPTSFAERCEHDGDYDLFVSGGGFGSLEGHRVFLSAVEGTIGSATQNSTFAQVVGVEGRLTYGAFALGCGASLHRNVGYPSWAVLVDVDDDGRCSAADVMTDLDQYTWDRSQYAYVGGGDDPASTNWRTVAAAGGVDGVCGRYGFPR